MSTPVTLRGNLTSDPELRFTASGKAVANFTVVTSRRTKNETTGEWTDADTTFWRCAAWGQMAENVAESLTKGTGVIVEGKAYNREYTTKEGDKRYSLDVLVDDVGASLKWATAKVTKASRGASGGATRGAPADDPWASSTPAGGGWSDEPPF